MDRLTFIRHSREQGFDIDEIRTLLSLQAASNQSCGQADAIAKALLVEVKRKIANLTALESELERMPARSRRNMQVIEILADHCKCTFHDCFALIG